MAKFQKRTPIFEAVQWDPKAKPADYPAWFWKDFVTGKPLIDFETGSLRFEESGGSYHLVPPGDWLIQGARGLLHYSVEEFETEFVQVSEPRASVD